MSQKPSYKAAVIDYGGGNLRSLGNMLEALAVEYTVLPEPQNLQGFSHLLLPGVGHFGQVMNALRQRGWDQAVLDALKTGMPFLGICVGLQVLFEGSEEAPEVSGLGVLSGTVKKYQAKKVPQIGWNRLQCPQETPYLEDAMVYFVNSYHGVPTDPHSITALADYEGPFVASVQRGNVSAFQFHPEKSGPVGHTILKRWFSHAG